MTFRALVVNKTDDHYQCELTQLSSEALPDEDVHLKVLYSSLNYKDGLAITGKAPVVRKFPMIPGIDLVAEVIQSRDEQFKAGDKVVLNGWSVGEKYWGGLAEYANLRGDWLIPLPSKLSAEQAMWIGTAGYTAMLSVMALQQHHISPESGPIVVTGAGGGVGSFAVYLLAKLGFKVIAVTGRESLHPYLKELGASEFMAREALDKPGKPLQKEQWAGAIDCVGSHTLANVCAGTQYGGVVACCGLAQGMDFPASVAPFILRGVTLAGIDSVMRPKADRIKAWAQLAELVDAKMLAKIGQTIPLEQALDYAHQLMDGQVKGRVAVKIA